NHLRRGTPDEPSVFAAGTGRVITQKQFIRLKEGDYVRNGVLHDASGEEVPVVTKQQAIAVNEALDEGKITCKEDVEQVLEEVKEDEQPLPEGEAQPVPGSEVPPVREDDGPPVREDDGAQVREDDGPPVREDDGAQVREDDGPPVRR